MTVHPRVCGERKDKAKAEVDRIGSSPRVRGTVEERHCEARAAVIPNSRDTDSRSSPRSRRSTVARLRPG